MALTFFSGFETGDFAEWTVVDGTPTVEEADGWGAPKTGSFAMRCNSGGAFTSVGRTGELCSRLSTSMYIVSAPDGLCVILSTSGRANVRLTTDRYLHLYDEGNEEVVGNTQLDVNTWYRISLCSDGVDSCKVYLNGVEEASSTSMGDPSLTPFIGIRSSVNADIYFDDCVADDIDSTNDIGDVRTLRSSPNAAGTHAEFDTASGYELCDEVPADGATTIVDDSGVSAMHRETYNLQDYATIGVGASDTWLAVNIWVQGYDAGETSQGITCRDDSTDYETLAEWGKAYTWKNKLYVGDAPRASAWTKEIFDTFQAGCYSEGSKDVYVSCVMVMVAYIPAVGGFFQDVGQGAIAIAGTLGLKTFIDVGDADVAIAGALVSVKRFILAVGSGAVGIAGTLGRNIFIAVGAAAMAIAGVLGRAIDISVGDGAIGMAGALGRYIKIDVGDGSMVIAGALNTIFRLSIGVGSGAVGIAGTLGRAINITVGQGGMTPSGVLGLFTKISIGAGSVGIAATLGRAIAIVLGSGAVGIAATLGRNIFKAIGGGAVGIAATLGRGVSIGVGGGAVGIAATLGRNIFKAVGQGAMAIAGTLGRGIGIGVGSGSVGITGTLGRNVFIAVGAGAVTIAGTLGRLTRKAVGAGAVGIAGVLGTAFTAIIFQAVGNGAVAISGHLVASYRYIEFTVKLLVRAATALLLSRAVISKLFQRSASMAMEPKPLSMTAKLYDRSVILKMRLV